MLDPDRRPRILWYWGCKNYPTRRYFFESRLRDRAYVFENNKLCDWNVVSKNPDQKKINSWGQEMDNSYLVGCAKVGEC